MKKLILCLLLILFCVSCLEIPTEGDERSIGHVDKLVYGYIDTVYTTRIIGRHGEITVYGNVDLNRFASSWWAYVDHVAGTVRFVDARHSRKFTPVYQICKERAR